MLFENKQYAAALAAIDTSIALLPGIARSHVNRASIQATLNDFEGAILSFDRALSLQPELIEIAMLPATLALSGQPMAGIAAAERVLAADPDNAAMASQHLFLLNYSDRHSAAEVAAAHRDWGVRFCRPLRATVRRHRNVPDPQRRLRLAYLSGDFVNHSIAYFIEAILRHHDAAKFEVFCYANTSEADAATARLKALAHHWREVADLNDAQLDDAIRADAIDVLVELSGHGGTCRLRALARRPAPVQISYLGYPNTTGVEAIDYRISDARADPPGQAEALSVESILRLPDCFHCYEPRPDAPMPSPRQGGGAGPITFGSFNVLPKISDTTLAAWATILRRLPTARLLIKARGGDHPATAARLLERFAKAGVGRERIEIVGFMASITGHLALYNRIDVCLDTFPYNGTTTTCEALWMGVPVIVLAGDRHAARVGLSLHHALDLEELVATTVDEYIALAIALASDPERRAGYHANLRDRMRRSPLLDAPRFVRNLESLFGAAWARWYADQGEAGVRLTEPHWLLRIRNGIEVAVPATWNAMTPYVLLEFEDWFEAEIDFVRGYLQPGMQVIDIGANYGLYTLSAAQAVGPEGRVFAFEPAPNTARFLAASCARNALQNVQICQFALSDRRGEAWFQLNENPELNHLVMNPEHSTELERVGIERLDDWAQGIAGLAPDFIKLDAEGHEAAVVAGAAAVLASSTALIMFELKHGAQISHGLIEEFTSRGFAIYRLMPGLGILVPFRVEDQGSVDGFLLNLFAAKAETADALAARRLLVREMPAQAPLDAGESAAKAEARATTLFLLAMSEQDAAARVAALIESGRAIAHACQLDPTLARLSGFARIHHALGQRTAAVAALEEATRRILAGEQVTVSAATLAAVPAAEAQSNVPGSATTTDPERIMVSLMTAYIMLCEYSGFFVDAARLRERIAPLLARLAAQGALPAPLERRRQLFEMRAGHQIALVAAAVLATRQADNLNPEFWSGKPLRA